ncbi:cyclin-dependent kinase regulatory subunit 1 [Capsaspora owczarzaki ATCC 30864]|uniref:Cyclin-dependent kinases regulatory subunit n=1 Tax=Capsaspora owczarzaki (strain ATCC 30864) TaxID=595528 RepID=A0A0D2WW94_CAPO3|nr:cyclin-dependent kinase regulatory subunit 1 [Capsaspora owczarzaki ATCC 30864]KJE96733.1 cyclin-dependent kinase regulatory subunit 1 [Capsaspora owczarzaki ATCC 30864]|eukprot:XP_004343732.1 cyclin-dependent kinase regulatory subunit 1 [Capsaspora owczarzaki ATCC 30864]
MSGRPEVNYSDKYYDSEFEYRHVIITPEMIKMLPKDETHLTGEPRPLLSEFQWRSMGVQQSRGWEHYLWHKPSPEVLLFRRPINYQQMIDAQQAAQAQIVAPMQ